MIALTNWLLATLSGVLVFLAFPSWNIHYLAWFAYVPLLVAARNATVRQAFVIGLWAGTVTNAGGFHWITEMLGEFGHLPAIASYAILGLEAVVQGLAFALGLALWRWLVQRGAPVALAAMLAMWAGEACIPMLFPWFLGNAISRELPMIQLADLGGVHLVSAQLYAANAVLADLISAPLGKRQPGWWMALITAVGIALSYGYGQLRIADIDGQQAAAPKLKIGMVEGNVGIWEKEAKHLPPEERAQMLAHNLLKHQQMTAQLQAQGAQLVVWPESAFQPPGPLPVVTSDDHVVAIGEQGAVWRHDGLKLQSGRSDRLGLPLKLASLTGLSSPRGDLWRWIEGDHRVWTISSRGAQSIDLPEGETAIATASPPADPWGGIPPGYVVGRGGRVWRLEFAGFATSADTGKLLPNHTPQLAEVPQDRPAIDVTAAAVNGSGALVVTGRQGRVLSLVQGRMQPVQSGTTADLWAAAGDPLGLNLVLAGAHGTVLMGDGRVFFQSLPTDVDLYAAWFAPDGTAWVAGQRGVILQRLPGKAWAKIAGLPPVDVMAGACDADGNLLVAGRGGRFFWRAQGHTDFAELPSGQRGEVTALLGVQALPSYYLPRLARRIVPAQAPLPDAKLSYPADALADAGVPEMDRATPRRGFTVPLLFGAMSHGGPLPMRSADCMDCYNSAVLLGSDGQVQDLYDKTFLLMFGEYLPFGEQFPSLYELSPETGHFQPGTRTTPVILGPARIGILVCYEDLLPNYARRVAAHNPNVFINMTNDAWFGQTAEPEHHLNLALMRTVEYRRWLLRSTNTGISVFIDAAGRRVQETSLQGAETLIRDVPLMESRTVYAQLGDWPLGVLGAGLLLLVAMGQGGARSGKSKRKRQAKAAAAA